MHVVSAALLLTVLGFGGRPDDAAMDETTLPVDLAPAFASIRWTGWTPELPDGTPNPIRPIVLTHAGDGSNRVFVATQHGVIHVFPNDDAARETKVFLDISDRVRYYDKENEEGFLGLAFHPEYRKNGQFYVYYSSSRTKRLSTISRFRVRPDDPDRADPDSEEILLTIPQPYWNHNGGTVVFGPDGFLYIGLGDGGAGNDPHGNGQKLNTLLGKILRIDVDRAEAPLAYAIPPDNPFVGREDARPEIWAYGIRNIWRMAFDPETGSLWAADVGQELWEEINLIERGGNYGWNLREGKHSFGKQGVGPREDLIEPIWEYHHSIGKSITGGFVYRGKQVPALSGGYLYADYVTGKMWALWYDRKAKRVTANREILRDNRPVLSFGEDEAREAYVLTFAADGRGIFRLVPKAHSR